MNNNVFNRLQSLTEQTIYKTALQIKAPRTTLYRLSKESDTIATKILIKLITILKDRGIPDDLILDRLTNDVRVSPTSKNNELAQKK